MASLRVREEVGLERPHLVRVVDRARWCPLVLACVAFWAVSTQLDLPRAPELVVYSFGQELGRHLLFSATAVFFLAAGVLGSAPAGLPAVLASRPLRWLGAVSYGVYLVHVDVLERLIQDPDPGRLPFWSLLGRVVFASLVLATLSYLLIERPLQRFSRRTFGRRNGAVTRPRRVPEIAGGLR